MAGLTTPTTKTRSMTERASVTTTLTATTTNKYRAKPTLVGNIRFASVKEANRYGELKLLFRAGVIQNLELQTALRFDLDGTHIFTYRADFTYFENGERVIEDVKGVRTPLYKLKKKLIEAQFNVQIRET